MEAFRGLLSIINHGTMFTQVMVDLASPAQGDLKPVRQKVICTTSTSARVVEIKENILHRLKESM